MRQGRAATGTGPRARARADARTRRATLVDGKLVAVGDSGQHGAYAIIDPDSGKTLEQGHLPLGDPPDASDDLEGLSTLDGKLVAISSAGWISVSTPFSTRVM